MVSVDGNDELGRLTAACRFVSSSLMALLLSSVVAAVLFSLSHLHVLSGTEDGIRCAACSLVVLPLVALIGGLGRMASILWGGAVAAGILACSVPMPLIAPIALTYAIVVTRRRLAQAGISASLCLLRSR